MDSKVINKLIRSEVWPILREQGFSHFDSRNAIAYHGPFVNVVNFQSYSSQLAGGLGCTTYSFGLNLGVYVLGSPWEERLKRDKRGLLLPPEYACSFRDHLKKRTPVDGFAREDIFYIHPDGRTTACCFSEVQYLLREIAPSWFSRHNDLDGIIALMQSIHRWDPAAELSTPSRPGSYSWNQLNSLLLLVKHKQSPTQDSAAVALEAIERTIGTVLDLSTIQADRPYEEGKARETRTLWDQLGQFKPVPVCEPKSTNLSGCLNGPIWVPANTSPQVCDLPVDSSIALSARKHLWPMLKSAGFTEFTDRLAHRVSKHCVEVVEFLHMDRFECKQLNLPAGLFRVGVGIFWPALRFDGLTRTNRNGDPRPIVNECHISNWLTPEILTHKRAGTAFCSLGDGLTAISGEGLGWLDLVGDYDSTLSLLQRKDWELFWCYPMMRGYGASSSSRRLMYIAFFKLSIGENDEAQDYIRRAELALPMWYPEHLRGRHGDWIEQVKDRLRGL